VGATQEAEGMVPGIANGEDADERELRFERALMTTENGVEASDLKERYGAGRLTSNVA
jgi:hypothetical protein